MKLSKFFSEIFKLNNSDSYEFKIDTSSNSLNDEKFEITNSNVLPSLMYNLDFIKTKYSTYINSDIVIRDFLLNIKDKEYSAFLLYIDGMVDSNSINDFVLKPLLLKNSLPSSLSSSQNKPKRFVRQASKFNLENFIYHSLIPQNSIKKLEKYDDIISCVNSGFCALFVDTLTVAFCIEAKGFKGRSVSVPNNEVIVRGPQEAFVENIRVNTSILRKIINNENLIIENVAVGSISKTPVGICYMKEIANESLISEVKYRINNLGIDYLISSGQLEQLIEDNKGSIYPELIVTERPDKTCTALLEGRVVILVNGNPYALIAPGVFIDFLSSPEDYNINPFLANFLKLLRFFASMFAVFLPGLYVAITNFHQELIPSNLLFAISSTRENLAFPVIFELIVMELSFELLREAGLRVPSPFGSTIGIIGALILGEAAVSANIVSPILIIIVAFTGICSFVIPDFSFSFSVRIFRFMYILLGYIAGFLGISAGFFIHFLILSNSKSFGVDYFSPYIPFSSISKNESYFLSPIWKREYRSLFLNTKRPKKEEKISMDWRNNG